MRAKGFVIRGYTVGRRQDGPQGFLEYVAARPVQVRRGPLQRLANDLSLVDRCAKESLCDPCDLPLLVDGRALARHRGRCADADDVVPAERHSAPTYEQGNIGTLSPAVGVELIEHEE